MSTIAAPRLDPSASPRPRARTRGRAAARARARCSSLAGVLNLWALEPQRLGQRLLQRRRALDELELARLPLRVVRPERRDDRRQAAARAVGPGAVGPGLRLPLAEHPRAAGAHGRRDGRARLRPRRAAASAGGRLRRRARARADADHGRDLAPQQPRRAARPCAASAPCGASCARCRTGARAGSCSRACASASASRRRWAPRCSSCPAIAAAWLWVAPRGRLAARAPAARRRRARWSSSAARGRC